MTVEESGAPPGERWGHRVSQMVGSEVKRYRRQRGMKILDLVQRCTELGHPLPRMTISNLENGRREGVTVPEVLVLAAALGVPPASLLVPAGSRPSVEVLDGVMAPTDAALEWIAQGWAPEGVPDISPRERQALVRVGRHAALVAIIRQVEREMEEGPGPEDARNLRDEALRAWLQLLSHRDVMREAGQVPPMLQPDLDEREKLDLARREAEADGLAIRRDGGQGASGLE